MMPRFEVTFSDCNAGWIYMSVRAGDQRADDIVLSQVDDPITQLLTWLEALAAGRCHRAAGRTSSTTGSTG